MKYQNPGSEKTYRSFLAHPETFPVSFCYDEKTYHGFPADAFVVVNKTCGGTAQKEDNDFVFSGPKGLTVELKTSFYPAYGAYEWTIWFVNSGETETALLSDVYALDMAFPGAQPVLRGILGDHENFYHPYVRDLSAERVEFVSDSGRATHVWFPYFNLEHGDGGSMLAIGWAGTWQASFEADGDSTRVRARSVIDLKLKLMPGERIRTALMLVAPYTVRDEDYATNYWRSWFINCNLPCFSKDEPMHPFSTAWLALDTGRPNSDGSISEGWDTWKPTMDKMQEIGVHPDFRWFDAGWYPDPDGNTVPTDWWGTVGVWELDKEKWPGDSFRQSVDYARELGMRTLVWFEPERVTSPDKLAKNYGYNTEWAIRRENTPVITNNLGHPDCFEWTTERICRMLRENHVDMYREDNNGDPGPLWRYLDAQTGRYGLSETIMIDAHYRMWDKFIETTLSYGGCGFVDSCASGGGRNDLLSLRKGVPLLRSDYDRTSTSMRLSMTTAFNRWVPMNGANSREKVGQVDAKGKTDAYIWRASYLPVMNIDSQYIYEPVENLPVLRAGVDEWQTIKPYMLKDMHVHTPWHENDDTSGLTAYSYFDPETGEGVLLAFRMETCEEDRLTVSLAYAGEATLTDADDKSVVETVNGCVELTFPEKRTARLLYIRKKS